LTIASVGVTAASAQASSRDAASHPAALSGSECAANKAAGTINWASSFAFAGAATILDVYAAQGLGYFADMCLTVNFITNSYNSEGLVSSDAAQISGEGSAADYLLAAVNGSNLRAIATDGDQSNYAILTQSKFKTLASLAGQTFGYHQTVPVVVSEMLEKAGVLKKVDFVADNSYDPTLLTDGNFGGIQAYQSNEPITLRSDGLKFNEFTPQESGVTGTMGVTIVNATFLNKYPSAVKDFLRADLKAFAYCDVHAVQCITIESKDASSAGVSYDFEHEYQRWKKESGISERSVLSGRGLGVQTRAEWASEDQALVTYKLLKTAPSLVKYENTSIAASLYNGTKLIWP
jgi:NitT/TauT family transport system substrate-binding protein